MTTADGWSKARRVVLHNQYTVITTKEVEKEGYSIFSMFETDTWHIDERFVVRLLDVLGYDIPERFHEALRVEINRIPAQSGGFETLWDKDIRNPDHMVAKITGPQLLELRLTYDESDGSQWVQNIAYCGGFTVEWAE